jgi:hypothetical protein
MFTNKAQKAQELTNCTSDTEDKEEPDGGHTFRAIFTKDDMLDWFDT